jgi:hypothetical protein
LFSFVMSSTDILVSAAHLWIFGKSAFSKM